MKIKILDPTFNGNLEIESPEGDVREPTSFSMNIEHIAHDTIPEVTIEFKAYLPILGYDLIPSYKEK